MGKKKVTGGKGSSPAVPVCNCEHPYNCDCGHRPPRPSKGHKWDPATQQWGGKGHKQKGAALGQAATVAKDKVMTTEIGKTTLAPHQRLPSAILKEYCQKQKRESPIYREIKTKQPDAFQYCLILPGNSASKEDLQFVPAVPVGNAEQAKEEAALLALLHFTPTLPHERTLPEPYRTTWLEALQSLKEAKLAANKKNHTNPPLMANASTSVMSTSDVSGSANADNAPGGAKASTGLRSAVPVSKSAKEEERKQKRQARNARIQKHEAIRLANQPHPVFMSAKLRQAIERILRHEKLDSNQDIVGNQREEEKEEEEAFYENTIESDVQEYVEDRLHNEGFTRKQARSAFQSLLSIAYDWEQVYDKALQWLLVNVDENDLPASFDPRGGTLDVIVGSNLAGDNEKISNDPKIRAFALTTGLSIQDATLICDGVEDAEQVLWHTACQLAGVTAPSYLSEQHDDGILSDELEALEAIFADECHVSRPDDHTIVLQLPLDGILSLWVTLDAMAYPHVWPRRILIKSDKEWKEGLSLLVEIAKFLSNDIAVGEPMIFSIHGHVQGLVSALDELPRVQLKPSKTSNQQERKPFQKSAYTVTSTTVNNHISTSIPMKRPRERSPFWSVPPAKTPPAVPFPRGALKHARASLPAASARSAFLKSLKQADNGSHVVLCTGETGCGKSTQLPQFILEEYPAEAKIVVCQPRRLAATGVANRVAEERGESKPGEESVGYIVRGDSAICKNSRLVFCTTGVLLRQLQNESALSCLTHVVIDEVHERNLDTDILLALLKQSLPSNPHLRVILMSATLDAERFLGYWDGETPSMHIPGRTYPVQDFTLEDVLAMTQYIPPKPKKGKPSNASADDDTDDYSGPVEAGDEVESVDESVRGHSVTDLVKRVDESSINYDLLAQLVRYLIRHRGPADDGSILIFLPGAPEIDRAMETVKKLTGDGSVQLLPLHGGLQPREQFRVFQAAGVGLTKIVFSTNVAETSITIPDCTVVIDTAREKQSSYDPVSRMPLLVEQFCSKASLKQRRGRAGRVREGTCYKLVSKATLKKLRDHSEPEIRRSALDQTLLSIAYLGMECRPSGGFMETLLDPPERKSIEAAAFSLLNLGAIEVDQSGRYTLTPLGVHLAGIPAPPIVGKILIMGSILGCRSAGIAMAAGMSVGRSPFIRINTSRKPRFGRDDTQPSLEEMKDARILHERKSLFKIVGNSDHAFLAAVYMKWESLKKGLERNRFCETMGLSFQGMRDVMQLANQLDSGLSSIGYKPSIDSDRNGKFWRVVRAVAVAGMAPGQLVKVVRPAAAYFETAEGAKEKDGEARELKFYIRTGNWNERDDTKAAEERVFLHPSSANFSTGSYNCPWLVFNSLVRTSKPFLRDVTECSGYSLLLLGGPIEVEAAKDIVTIDRYCQLGAHARIGSLVGGLKQRLDDLLTEKIKIPSFDIAATPEMATIVKLIVTDGLGA